MGEAFQLYETNTQWIDSSENFVNVKNRKMNSLVVEESLKSLDDAVKLLEEKEKNAEGEKNDAGVQIIKNRLEIVKTAQEKI